jgi:hypothetical protein
MPVSASMEEALDRTRQSGSRCDTCRSDDQTIASDLHAPAAASDAVVGTSPRVPRVADPSR